MALDLKKQTDFLVSLGTEEIDHSGDKGFLAHLIAVCRYLEEWGYSDDVCLAGLFHSIYGTELFQDFSLAVERRHEVREIAGERAEYLAYLNCAMDRPSFDALVQSRTREDGAAPNPGTASCLVDRLTGETVELTQQDYEDLLAIQILDWLEQVGRSKWWDYRRDAYRAMAVELGGRVSAEYERVFAQAPKAADASGRS